MSEIGVFKVIWQKGLIVFYICSIATTIITFKSTTLIRFFLDFVNKNVPQADFCSANEFSPWMSIILHANYLFFCLCLCVASVAYLLYVRHLGGILAVANIRGGGEYGLTWHKGTHLGQQKDIIDLLRVGIC